VIPAPFTYQRAGSVDEALSLAAEGGDDAKFLAGGHSLLPLMKLRLAVPEVLIDIGRLSELSYVREENGHIAVVAPRGTFPRTVLNLVGAGSLFGVFETRDEALTHVRERLTA